MHVPFWGATLPISIDGTKPSARQLDVLRAIVSYEGNVREDLQQKLYDYYNEFGYFDEEYTPALNQPPEIWKLVDSPSILIRPLKDTGSSIVFVLYTNCSWDEEHGISICFKDWTIIDIGVGLSADGWQDE